MLFLGCPENYNVIPDVSTSLDGLNDLLDCVLEDFRAGGDTEIESGISLQTFMGGKSSDVARRRIKFYLE